MEKMTCLKLRQKIRLFQERKRNFDDELKACARKRDSVELKMLTASYEKLEKNILNLRGKIAKERYDKIEYVKEAVLEAYVDDVVHLAMLTTGELVSASKGGILKMWNLENKEELRNLKSFAESVRAVESMNNGDFLSADTNGVVMIRSGETGEEKTQITGAYKYIRTMVEVSGQSVAFGNDRDIIIWDHKNKTHKVLSGHAGSVRTLAIGPDGKLISGARNTNEGEDGTIKIWDTETGKQLRSFKHPKYDKCDVENLMISCRGDIIWSVGNEINCYDYVTGKEKWVQKTGNYYNRISSIKETRDHKIVARVESGGIYIVDPHTGMKLKVMKAEGFFDDSLAVMDDRIIYGYKNEIRVLKKTRK